MAMMHNPPHPGVTLREDVLPALGLSITEAAEQLDVTRVALSRVLNGQAAISDSMALRLEKWLGPDNGGTADVWIGLQKQHDLWQARQQMAKDLKRVKPAKLKESEHAAARDGQARSSAGDFQR